MHPVEWLAGVYAGHPLAVFVLGIVISVVCTAVGNELRDVLFLRPRRLTLKWSVAGLEAQARRFDHLRADSTQLMLDLAADFLAGVIFSLLIGTVTTLFLLARIPTRGDVGTALYVQALAHDCGLLFGIASAVTMFAGLALKIRRYQHPESYRSRLAQRIERKRAAQAAVR